jgi:hypothetical protein
VLGQGGAQGVVVQGDRERDPLAAFEVRAGPCRRPGRPVRPGGAVGVGRVGVVVGVVVEQCSGAGVVVEQCSGAGVLGRAVPGGVLGRVGGVEAAGEGFAGEVEQGLRAAFGQRPRGLGEAPRVWWRL